MRVFRDNDGREWVIKVTKRLIDRIKASLGMDLFELKQLPQHYQTLADDLPVLLNFMWLVCEEQATKLGIDEEAFCAALAGDTFDAFLLAFQEEFVDFFPSARREVLRATTETANRVVKLSAERAARQVTSEAVTKVLEATAEKAEKRFQEHLSAVISADLPVLQG